MTSVVGTASVNGLATGSPMEKTSKFIKTNVNFINKTHGVLDLTFSDIREEPDFETALITKLPPLALSFTEVRSVRITSFLSSYIHINLPTIIIYQQNTTGRKQTEVIKALRLGNNEIRSMEIIYKFLKNTLDTTNIMWLDLSFNKVETISVNIMKYFPNITTLNLHANRISRLSELRKLALLTTVKAISLQGNPVEEHKHYRNFVLYFCPWLRQFDMSPVTAGEVKRMNVWAVTFRRVLNGNDSDDDY
jgi:Leucine-rich repeat (LRR) protein